MKNIVFLIVVAACLFSSDLSARISQIRNVTNQMQQTRRAVSAKMPKARQVVRVPVHRTPSVPRVPAIKRKPSAIHEFKPTLLDSNALKSLQSEKKYLSAFASLSKDTTATGEDYLQLYFTMGCDSQYSPLLYKLEYETVVDKYLDIDSPTPERLAEVLATARQQFPKQRHILTLHTPSTLLLERATRRYYSQVSEADSTFTARDAAILCQLFDEYRQGMNNEGNVLYYYLTGLYEYALPPLERYFKVLEENPASEGYLNRRIDEAAPRFRLLERCYEAMGFSEQRDSLLASPVYKRTIKS